MIDKDVADLRQEMDMLLQGQMHLFCALADALEKRGELEKDQLAATIRGKIEWLENANTPIEVATPLLVVEEWLKTPPPDPSDPYEGAPGPRLVKGGD